MLPEEITKFIGQSTGGIRVMEVEKGSIRRFAESVDDPNLLYCDEEYARNSKYGSIISVPGFFGWPAKGVRAGGQMGGIPELNAALAKNGFGRVLDGGMEYEFFCPVRAGDTLAATSFIKDITEVEGRTGKMAIMITETTYLNQNGDLVARARGTSIRR